MTVTIIIDPALRQKIADALSEMSRTHHRSIARLIRPEFFEIVTDAIAEDIDVTFGDFGCSLIASASRVRERMPHAFVRSRVHANAMTISERHRE